MAVPSSGPLELWNDIWNSELGGTKGNNSLHSASVYAGFSIPDAMSDFYGWSDVEVPSVTSNSATSVTTDSMQANGTLNNTGNENPDRGFYFGTNGAAAGNNTKYSIGTGGTGAFSRSMTGLTYATYYYWAYASNSAGEAVGARITQTTTVPPFTPTYANRPVGCAVTQTSSPVGDLGGYRYYLNPYDGSSVQYGTTGQYTYWNSAPSVTNAKNRWIQGGFGWGGNSSFSNLNARVWNRGGFSDLSTGMEGGGANFCKSSYTYPANHEICTVTNTCLGNFPTLPSTTTSYLYQCWCNS